MWYEVFSVYINNIKKPSLFNMMAKYMNTWDTAFCWHWMVQFTQPVNYKFYFVNHFCNWLFAVYTVPIFYKHVETSAIRENMTEILDNSD